ncbi:hypothetical protein Tco_1345996, partial [Tanacetum coccineum]
NFPTQTLVVDEAAFISVDVIHGGAATTVSNIDVGQGSGNITKSPTMAHDLPLLGGHTLGSDEGSMTLLELTVLCTNLSNKVESLETELKKTKQTYGAAFTKLIKNVKKLEQTVKTSQARRKIKIIASNDEEDLVAEDPSKQGRSMIEEIDLDAEISLVPLHVEVQGRYGQNLDTQEGFGAGPEVTTADVELNTTSTFEDETWRAVQISRDVEVALKLQEEFNAAERKRMTQVHQAAQVFTDAEWDDVLARVVADEDFVQQLQAGE